jgi:hypothetical protein
MQQAEQRRAELWQRVTELQRQVDEYLHSRAEWNEADLQLVSLSNRIDEAQGRTLQALRRKLSQPRQQGGAY